MGLAPRAWVVVGQNRVDRFAAAGPYDCTALTQSNSVSESPTAERDLVGPRFYGEACAAKRACPELSADDRAQTFSPYQPGLFTLQRHPGYPALTSFFAMGNSCPGKMPLASSWIRRDAPDLRRGLVEYFRQVKGIIRSRASVGSKPQLIASSLVQVFPPLIIGWPRRESISLRT